jgi:xanthosine utilization system XapX-like protein
MKMVKKRKRKSQMRELGGTILGAGTVGMMTPLLSDRSPAALQNATQGMVGIAVMAPMADIAFSSIDRIYQSEKKKGYL